MSTWIRETAAETAKKIRATLKKAFPGVKFSVRSKTYSMGDSVYVSWTDGPLEEDVNRILERFESGYYDGMQDMYVFTGYEWEGQTIVGAKYISCGRTLSPERRAKIEAKLQEEFTPDCWGCFLKSDWTEAERQLIVSGELQGYPSQLPASEEKSAEDEPVQILPKGGKVIPFPVRAVQDPEEAVKLEAERILQSFTPEQKLKLQLLQTMFGIEEVTNMLLFGYLSVDDIFKITAERIFGSKG